MRTFADWGATKTWVVVGEDYPENELYLEAGCPRYAMIEYINAGFKIFVCPGQLVSDFRKELKLEKTGENDAALIQKLFYRSSEAFVEFTRPQQVELLKRQTMSEYEAVTKHLTAIKNQYSAMQKEYGPNDVYEDIIKQLERRKVLLIRAVKPHIKEELSKVCDVKGVGITLVARVLALAHPNRFPSKSAYLNYNGFTQKTRDSNKFDRAPKSVFHLIAKQTMMANDSFYRGMYDDIKAKTFKKVCSSCWLTKNGHKCKKRKSDDQDVCPIRAHEVAMNRMATHLAGMFWKKLHGVEAVELGESFE